MGLKIPRSTTLAPPSPRLAVGTAQHRSFPRSLVLSPTSTPKPRAEGRVRAGGTQATSRPERSGDQVLLPLPKIALLLLQWRCFLSLGGTSWQQGAPAGSPAVRVVGTCSPVGCVQRRSRLPLRSVLGAPHWGAAPESAGETSPSLHLHHAMEELPSLSLLYSVLSHPSSTVPTPSNTQNAPGFAFFGLNRVRFSLFRCFWGAKFLPALLCILPHSGYKLKPSVMPCRREVSFLT